MCCCSVEFAAHCGGYWLHRVPLYFKSDSIRLRYAEQSSTCYPYVSPSVPSAAVVRDAWVPRWCVVGAYVALQRRPSPPHALTCYLPPTARCSSMTAAQEHLAGTTDGPRCVTVRPHKKPSVTQWCLAESTHNISMQT